MKISVKILLFYLMLFFSTSIFAEGDNYYISQGMPKLSATWGKNELLQAMASLEKIKVQDTNKIPNLINSGRPYFLKLVTSIEIPRSLSEIPDLEMLDTRLSFSKIILLFYAQLSITTKNYDYSNELSLIFQDILKFTSRLIVLVGQKIAGTTNDNKIKGFELQKKGFIQIVSGGVNSLSTFNNDEARIGLSKVLITSITEVKNYLDENEKRKIKEILLMYKINNPEFTKFVEQLS